MERSSYSNYILKGRNKFNILFRLGSTVSLQGTSLLKYDKLDAFPTRIAICVSKKEGGAVKRNRLKRITRAAIYEFLPELRPGFYVAIFPKIALNNLKPPLRNSLLYKLFIKSDLLPGYDLQI